MSIGTTLSLSGHTLGISGAVPERKHWTEPSQDRAILEFVALLSGLAFKYKAKLVHGAHPAFTPVILRQAELQGVSAEAVTICMSNLWARDLPESERARFQRESDFIVVQEVGDGGPADADTRNASLTAMRRVMIPKMTALVAIGGMRHAGTGLNPGVAEEIALAQENRLPCFIVGGFGGEAAHWARAYDPCSLQNGLTPEANHELLTSNNVAACAGLIFDHLARQGSIASS